MNDSEHPPIKTWPPGRELPDDECVELSCVNCRTHWRIHDRLRGFRLRCTCNTWLQIPDPAGTTDSTQLIATDSDAGLPPATQERRKFQRDATVDEHGLIKIPEDEGDVIYTSIPTDAPLAPGAMARASHSNRRHWTNRTLLEFVLLMAALLGPQILASLMTENNEFALLLPFASLLSGVLVASIIAWAGPYGRLGLRSASLGYVLEAVGVAALSVAIAMLYMRMLEQVFTDTDGGFDSVIEQLGLEASLFVIAVTPAVLEEIIFRGMLQGRLMALLGRSSGFNVTACAFAVVHGQPAVLPIHLGFGLYLGWLRHRSNSLLPGMLMQSILPIPGTFSSLIISVTVVSPSAVCRLRGRSRGSTFFGISAVKQIQQL